MSEWLAALAQWAHAGQPCVVVTVASSTGSVPRDAGTKMTVSATAVAGTIGGGHLELTAIGIAREMLAAQRPAELRRFALGASLGQCCGGAANLLFEPADGEVAWIGPLMDLVQDDEPHVVVTPERGAEKLLVTASECGGEVALVARARALLGTQAALLETIAGRRVLFEPSAPCELRVVLFGAGHVGRALVQVLGALPLRLTWIDSREGEFPRHVPANTAIELTDAALEEVSKAPLGACYLVMTHSHALDFELTEAILRRGDYRYFGLIGSRTKRRSFEQRLRARGVDAAALASMTCPIGLPGIVGKEPATIAIAIAAQLLQCRPSIATLAPRERQAAR